jgi:intracellular multiplication protein IcmD
MLLKYFTQFRLWFFFVMVFSSFQVNAQAAQNLGSIAENVTHTFSALAKLITATAYVTGAGMFFIAVFQFKQHKENPTQVPLSKPMMFLALGCALLFFPTFVNITENTIFGENAVSAGPQGVLLGV